jgi:ATP-dependent Clp protease ATP-binding subunit ClpC
MIAVFERYTEPARRVLFFARYEASQLGSLSIESDHLLLGLIREPKGIAARVLNALPLERIRSDIEQRTVFREKVPTSVEIPFSAEVKRMLSLGAEEADRFPHSHIGPEHLLLGLLREKGSLAAETLAQHGVQLESARQKIVAIGQPPSSRADAPDRVALQERVDQIADLVQGLQQLASSDSEVSMRVDLLLADLRALKALLDSRR